MSADSEAQTEGIEAAIMEHQRKVTSELKSNLDLSIYSFLISRPFYFIYQYWSKAVHFSYTAFFIYSFYSSFQRWKQKNIDS